jgi:UDP-3-O-[3-hydroxymyristoyl] glucosamine N-acyltransferase
MADVPAGAKYCGAPAQPITDFFREQATLRRIARSAGRRAGRPLVGPSGEPEP